jgi:outer membrane protein OmpA-like peptidoglycan-associated protein
MHMLLKYGLPFLLALGMVLPGCKYRQAMRKQGIDSRQAYKSFQQGKQQRSYRSYGEAYTYFKEAVSLEPDWPEANIQTGIAAFELKNYEEAVQYLEKGVKLDPDTDHSAYYFLGRAYFEQNNYTKAEQYLDQYLEGQTQSFTFEKRAKKLLKQAAFSAEAKQDPIQFKPQNMGNNINSPGDDYMPMLTADGQMIFFTSRRAGNIGGYNKRIQDYEEDFYYSTRQADSSWSEAKNLGRPINTELSEGAAAISPDGRYVYFVGCNRRDVFGRCDIYVAEYEGNEWTEPQNMGPKINSKFWESYPSISSDGKTLFFSSRRPGGHGQADIWYSRKVDGEWTAAKNLGKPVNTSGDEHSPFLHADDQTLYFSSNGHQGFGSMDLFMARRQDEGLADSSWSKPENLGYPLNTAGDERTLFVNTQGTRGYMNSDRLEGMGGIDIYSFKMDPAIQPSPATFVRGTVQDSLTGEPIGGANIQFIELGSGDTVRAARSSKLAGEFLVSLPLGQDYAAFVEAKGYLFHSQNFSLKGLAQQQNDSIRYYDLLIELNPIQAGGLVQLNNIFFDLDKATLKPESYVELRRLARFLKQNPKVRIQLRGHTDSQGSKAYNKDLSERRAQAVKSYLVEEHEIDPARLAAKGFGESMPIATNETEAGRAQNRRTEFRVLKADKASENQ